MTRYFNKPWMTASEYRANLQGLNVFFGAVLGAVRAGAERLNAWDYGMTLLLVASLIITILYISSSKRRLLYSAYALIAIAVPPRFVDKLIDGKIASLVYLQVTLLVWALMAILVEFAPRERSEIPVPPTED